jgi:predicted esterase
VAAGFSNGGAWAVAAAQRRPDVFAQVAAFSVGVVPGRITGKSRATGVRHYLAAGTLERGFRRVTRQWAKRLQRAGWTAATTSGSVAMTTCGGSSSSPGPRVAPHLG